MSVVLEPYELFFYCLVISWGVLRYHYFNKHIENDECRIPNFNEYNTLLEKENPYYANLTINGRLKFISRLREIRDNIEVQGREDFEVTEEVVVLISACIAQLTYGFNSPVVPILKGVVVYPSIFFSKLSNAWVKGLAMGNGVVFLSWDSFKEGYLFSTSTYNLGLHEFAHILRLQAQQIDFKDVRLSEYFDDWEENGADAYLNIREGNQDFFREYGGSNRAEFFSVCIENFFEVPEKFEQKLPDVYWHLCYLMKQNPLNTKEDYSFTIADRQVANEDVRDKIRLYDVFYTQFEYLMWQFLGVFWFIGLFFIFILMSITDEKEIIILFRMAVVASILNLLVRLHYYQNLASLKEREYLYHFFTRVVPVTIGLTIFYNLFSH